MRRTQQPVQVYERKGADGLITFYHHVTVHGSRTRERLASLGRHKYNSRSYLRARKAAQEAALVRSADVVRGEFGLVTNRGNLCFMVLVEEHCAGKSRESWRVAQARKYWGNTKLAQVTTRKVQEYKKELMDRYADKTAFQLFTITCKAVLKNAAEEGWIRTDPSRKVQNPPNIAKNKSALLNIDEVRLWLEWEPKASSRRTSKADMSAIHRASCFMLHTGLLRADIMNLTYADIADGYIELVRSKNKTKQHARSFCLALSEDALHFAGSGKADERLFLYVADSYFRDCLRFIAADLGIDKKVNIRTFRHTLLTQMALNGAGAHAIQSVAGHSRITMSQEYVRRTDQLQIQSLNNVYRV